MNPGIVKHESNAQVVQSQDPKVEERLLIDVGDYAEALTATWLYFHSGKSLPRVIADKDQLVFITSGDGQMHFSDGTVPATRGTAVLIRAGESWSVVTESLKMICVEVPRGGPNARKLEVPATQISRSVALGNLTRGQATGDREFEVLFDASNGSTGATMFVGFIPQSGAPAHYHLYDEICCIIQGEGRLLVGDTSQPISAGSTFAITPRLLHSLVNESAEFLWILGIFRPQGTPAAAYYPDGRPAPGYEEVTPPN